MEIRVAIGMDNRLSLIRIVIGIVVNLLILNRDEGIVQDVTEIMCRMIKGSK